MGLVQRCARPMVVHNEIIEKELVAVEGTQYVTKESILRRAQEIKGIPLRDVDKTGRLATGKGAIGTVIEESWFGYTPNSESEPDFPEAGVELKVTPYLRGKNGIRAKERLVCNIINYMEEYDKTFQTSAFWHKCNTMLLMSYEHLADKPKGDYRIDEAVLVSRKRILLSLSTTGKLSWKRSVQAVLMNFRRVTHFILRLVQREPMHPASDSNRFQSFLQNSGHIL